MCMHVLLKDSLIAVVTHSILYILMNAPNLKPAVLKALWLLLSILKQTLIPVTFLLLLEILISLKLFLTKEAQQKG